ncbi:antitoxin Xre/MbcA/ParS toxin-binding domain-containing protein [Flavihumibacter sp. ZG627]|uniref:type II RES/Xre toxin-antitoxin system antitoxin n=1 Tax=Flavihumibacter sp. ZG627 TaxID=1463156 RepID=UPI0009E50FF7|nr:antitoxin Xre/MbcA/ParS toxin-binding domain-containing protein [Flavihumibacter sp. ZG627]
MKTKISQQSFNKPGTKAAKKNSRSKSTGKVNPPKETLTKARKLSQFSLFSYKSADDKNIIAIIDIVRTGIAFHDFENIVGKTPFSMAEWATYLQLSERTIQRNQKEGRPFQPIQSERIVELVMLYNYGVEVFGDKENFNIWLNSKSIALGGKAPKEFLDTMFGVGMIKDELGRIEHGVLA